MRTFSLVAALTLLGIFTFAMAAPNQMSKRAASQKGNRIENQSGKRAASQKGKAISKGASSWQEAAFIRSEEQRAIEAVRYKGTTAIPHPDAKGHEKQMQLQLAKALSRVDFVPDDRITYFQGNSGLADTLIIGWSAQIIDVTPVEEGVQLRVKIEPKHANGGMMTRDYVTESYIFSNGQMHYQGLVKPENRGITTWT